MPAEHDPTDEETTPWWSYPDQMAALYLFLVNTDRLDPADSTAVAHVLSRPWRYEAEHAEMTARRTANDADTSAHIRLVRER